MNYQLPDAAQRMMKELLRTAWASDRKFFCDHPTRNYRLRPALDVEVALQELAYGAVQPCAPWERVYISIRQLAPGMSSRLLFIGPAVNPWTDPPEDFCRKEHAGLYAIYPKALENEQAKIAEIQGARR